MDSSEGTSTGNSICKMHLAGSEAMSDSIWWEQRADRDGAEGGRLGQVKRGMLINGIRTQGSLAGQGLT